MSGQKGRARRVGTKLVEPAPPTVEPLELDVSRDEDGAESPTRDALLDYGPFVAMLVLLALLFWWALSRMTAS